MDSRHLESKVPLSYYWGRQLEGLKLVSNLPRDVEGDVGLGSHSALDCQGVHYGQDKYRPFSHFHFMLAFVAKIKIFVKQKCFPDMQK